MVSGVDFEPKDPGFKPHTAQKKRKKKIKVLPGEQKINSESTSETSGHEFCALFSGTETLGLTKTSETHTEVSVERKPENFTNFRPNITFF
jgi:hypothetical protein